MHGANHAFSIFGHKQRPFTTGHTVGHNTDNWAKSWNFAHQSAGCGQDALVRTGGSGKFYCFATN